MDAIGNRGSAPNHLLDVIDLLVDNRVGIIKRVRALPKDKGAPDLSYMSAATCNLDVLNPHRRQGIFIGTGVAADRSRAMSKATGEAIERYCDATSLTTNFPLADFQSAGFPCIDPDEFVLFSAAQYTQPDFPFIPFTRHTQVHWVPALDLKLKETVSVPAPMVFLTYDQSKAGSVITQQISTGLACHSSPTLAALKAICEVIERDAIAVTWLTKLPKPKIRLDTLSRQNRELLARLNQPGTTVTLLHLVMDHAIPVIFSMMQSNVPEAPALVVAAAAHLDPEQAVRRSLEELGQIWSFSQSVKSQRPKFNPGISWKNVVDLESHALLYFAHENKRFAGFLWNSPEEIAFSKISKLSTGQPTHDLRIVTEEIAATNHRVVLVDITSEDIKTLGLSVFRALIPGFQPLFMGHRFRALGGSRLNEVHQRLGFSAVIREEDLNTVPHPFS